MGRAGHGVALGRAHFVAANLRLTAQGLDEVSLDCLGCHDDSAARGHGPQLRVGIGENSHPVGRSYDEHSRKGRKDRLKPRQSLPASVQLPGGTVGCISCHSPFSAEPAMLTETIYMSRLCYACHDM